MIKHVVHCDGPGCDESAEVGPPPIPTANWMPPTQMWFVERPCPVGQRMPEGWRKVDGEDFCSWACIERHAGREKAT